MLPEGSIAARRIWKRFRSRAPRMLLRDQVEQLWSRSKRSDNDWRWVLRDVDLEVEPGAAVALVGANGSGKSTLLKILTGVMEPYAGQRQLSGRIGALIEVMSGIHPDLTGRENVFLYGTLLGMGRREVARRFDEIVAFAELEDAIDRQVKRYSSGMQMRLAFSVVAFLDPQILIVDEVLAVGDASFQQRCMDRMRYVLSQGTTLVLVSHDLASVEAACKRVLWLEEGVVVDDGPAREVLSGYRARFEQQAAARDQAMDMLELADISVTGPEGTAASGQLPLDIRLELHSPEAVEARIHLGVSEGTPSPMFVVSSTTQLGSGSTAVQCWIETLPLPRGRFFLWLAVTDTRGSDLLHWRPVAELELDGPPLDTPPPAVVRLAAVHVDASWLARPGAIGRIGAVSETRRRRARASQGES